MWNTHVEDSGGRLRWKIHVEDSDGRLRWKIGKEGRIRSETTGEQHSLQLDSEPLPSRMRGEGGGGGGHRRRPLCYNLTLIHTTPPVPLLVKLMYHCW